MYTENRDSESHDDDEGKSILSRNFSPIVSFVTYLFRAAAMYISYKHCLRVAGWLAGWIRSESQPSTEEQHRKIMMMLHT